MKKHIIIVGATSSIAEHCARLWVSSEAVDITLVGRDAEKMERIAADLRARNPRGNVQTQAMDFLDANSIATTIAALAAQKPVDIALIAHGALPDQTQCQNDLAVNAAALKLNGISPVLFAEAFASAMQKADRGTIALIGSVAGDRGRKSNYVYGSAKGLVARYAQGLQHRLATTNVKVIIVKPGPTDTPMTAHLKQKGVGLASVESVAALIVSGIDKGQPVIYAPSKWRLIMLVITHLPSFVFNQMNI